MATATKPVLAGEAADRNASPDWVKSQYGGNGGHKEQTAGGEPVELKYRSLANLGSGKFAKGLGLFSIGLGLAEILAPARVGELAGLSSRYRSFLPALGAREIASGIAIMKGAKPTTAVWSRVGGDAIDLAFLGAGFMGKDTNKRRLTGAAIAVAGVTLLDLMCAKKLSSQTWSESDGNPKAPTTVGQPSARV